MKLNAFTLTEEWLAELKQRADADEFEQQSYRDDLLICIAEINRLRDELQLVDDWKSRGGKHARTDNGNA